MSAYNDRLGGHWLALDIKGSFARAELKLVERITPLGIAPALIVADGGAPISMNKDGNLYYGLDVSSGIAVGMTRISPDGAQQPFAPELGKTIEKLGITGIASGPDGTLYVACPTRIIKVKTDGTFAALVDSVTVKNCDGDAPTVFLRGLDVDARDNVYAAACGCRCVVKVTPQARITTVLKAERPWSPTGVAVHGEDVYVLEHTNANGALKEGWLPRVRKLGRDGKVTTLATISEEQQKAQPNNQIPRRVRTASQVGRASDAFRDTSSILLLSPSVGDEVTSL